MASWFGSYNELANGVQEFIQVDIPPLDLSSLQKVALFIDEREGEVLDCMDELRSRHPDPLCLIAVSWYQPQRRN